MGVYKVLTQALLGPLGCIQGVLTIDHMEVLGLKHTHDGVWDVMLDFYHQQGPGSFAKSFKGLGFRVSGLGT